MKKLFFLLFAGCCFDSFCGDLAPDVLYAHEEWGAALAGYEKEPHPSAGTLIRMGECAFRQKEYSRALQYLYRGLSGVYGVTFYMVSFYIVTVLRATGQQAHAAVSPTWYIATSLAAVPPLVWQLLALFLLIGLLWRLRWWWGERRYILLSLVGCGVISLGTLALWSLGYRSRIGGVVHQSAVLRSGPDARYTEVGSLSAGTPVEILGAPQQLPGGSGTVHVKVMALHQKGWVAHDALLLV